MHLDIADYRLMWMKILGTLSDLILLFIYDAWIALGYSSKWSKRHIGFDFETEFEKRTVKDSLWHLIQENTTDLIIYRFFDIIKAESFVTAIISVAAISWTSILLSLGACKITGH